MTKPCENASVKMYPNQQHKCSSSPCSSKGKEDDLRTEMPDVERETSAVGINAKSRQETSGGDDILEHYVENSCSTLEADHENEHMDNQITL